MKLAIIGSGISALTTAQTFLNAGYEIYFFDSNDFNKKNNPNKKLSFFPKVTTSPKYNDINIKKSISRFKKKYRIKTKNFFLASSLISGGMSNFWGGGIEIPSKKYLNQYIDGGLILKEQRHINKILGIGNKNIFKFYNYFYNQKFIKNLINFKKNNTYLKKLASAANQNDKNLIFNSKNEIKKLSNNALFKYLPNKFITNLKKKDKKYIIRTDDNKRYYPIKFDKIIISAGTVGSTILVSKILNIKESFKLSHTPTLKLAYFSLTLPFKIKTKKKYKQPLLKIITNINQKILHGSFMHADNLDNYFFGVKKINFFFNIIKKFIFVGNLFFPSEYSLTSLKNVGNKMEIISNDNDKMKKEIPLLRKKINDFFKNFNIFEIPYQNLVKLKNGSDAHYTSSLYDCKINNKKILNKYSELYKFKNLYVLDGSSIASGLIYPTYFLMLYASFIAKRIILNDKKN